MVKDNSKNCYIDLSVSTQLSKKGKVEGNSNSFDYVVAHINTDKSTELYEATIGPINEFISIKNTHDRMQDKRSSSFNRLIIS